MNESRLIPDLNALGKMTNTELKRMVIDTIAARQDDAIESELLLDLVDKYVELTEQLHEKIEEVNLLSITDALTGAYNRLHFGRVFESELNRFGRSGQSFSFVMFDIDHFKKVNDTYGHAIGDEVLIKVSDIVKKTIREVDTFARWGGEEFVVLLTDSDDENALIIAERIRHNIAEYKFHSVGTVTCSFGVTTVCQGESLNKVSIRVDEALYEAKSSGRNRVKLAIC